MSLANPVSPTQWKIPQDRNPRPAPPRRPSAMRSPSSDHIITPAVTRFDPETADIPPSPTFNPDEVTLQATSPFDSKSSAESTGTFDTATTKTTSDPSSVPPPPSFPHRAATSPVASLARKNSTTTSPPQPGSLLARRRSSRSTARPDFLPKLDDLKLPSLPVPPLEELDDTVVPDVIGVGSQATTPFAVSPTSTRDVQEAPFRPTKSYASTPFPKGRRQSFFDESDEEDRESGNSDDDDGRSTAESSVLDESTDGIRRFSLTDGDDTSKVSS
ncbi:hypothetical protein JCM16303_002612 [Sporobolomyces ruberrimus]